MPPLPLRFAALVFASASLVLVGESQALNQTGTTTPVIVGGDLPYSVELRRMDFGATEIPSLHSYVAAEQDGQWVVIAGLTNGLHGFDIDRDLIPDRKENRDVWVIDPQTKQSWHRTLEPSDPGSGLDDAQLLTLIGANAQFEQVDDRLYMVGGYGDDDVNDPESRDTHSNLTEFNLPGLVDWAKGGSGQAADHIRQLEDPLFKVTGGELLEVDGEMLLVFGQDYQGRYRGFLNGEYTKQVRRFTIDGTGDDLAFTSTGSSTPEEHFRRRDLNVFPTIVGEGEGLREGVTVLSGVFTEDGGAWTVPVEIGPDGIPVQADGGLDPMNAGDALDGDNSVFKQGMNNYHSAKIGLFSEATGEMHEVLFGGITLQEYLPDDPRADASGFVTDVDLPNTNQISTVVRNADGTYEQHFLGEFPELFSVDDERLRFGSNAEFFANPDLTAYENGVIDLDSLAGETSVGYIYGGLIANAPHIFFNNPQGLSAASGEVWEVVLTTIPEPTTAMVAGLACLAIGASRRR